MTGNVEQAEDFTQDAFMQLYRKIGSFRGDSAFSTWLSSREIGDDPGLSQSPKFADM
jgi:DNA-directed RNA polymerase specialized sigma24 family protein